jgi:hypothetical protein
VLQALRNSCRRFCRDTEWWRAEVTADWLGKNAKAYVLVAGAGESEINGTYITTGETSNSHDVYQHETANYAIRRSVTGWEIQSLTTGPAIVYYSSTQDVSTPDQVTGASLIGGWTVGLGDSPAPTVTLITNTLIDEYSDAQLIRVQWVTVDNADSPEWARTVSNDGLLTFDPALPASADVIKAEIVLMPTITANSVEDHLVSRFGETIAQGARYELKADKGSEVDPNPWYDPEGASLALRTYQGGVGDARLEVFSGRESGEKQVDLMGGIW